MRKNKSCERSFIILRKKSPIVSCPPQKSGVSKAFVIKLGQHKLLCAALLDLRIPLSS